MTPAGAKQSEARRSRCHQVLDVSGIFQAKGDAGDWHVLACSLVSPEAQKTSHSIMAPVLDLAMTDSAEMLGVVVLFRQYFEPA